MTKEANESGEHERVKGTGGPVTGFFTLIGYFIASLFGVSTKDERHETSDHPVDKGGEE